MNQYRYKQRGRVLWVVMMVLAGVAVAAALLSTGKQAEGKFIPLPKAPQNAVQNPAGHMAGSLSEMAAGLRQRLESSSPEDAQGWWLLGRTYMELNDNGQALYALQKAQQLAPENAEVQQLLTQLRGGEGAMSSAADPAADPAAATVAAAGLTVSVGIDPALAASVRAGDVLYVYAKALNGPRFPLAVKRLAATGLPLTVQLTDADALMGAGKLSDFQQLTVGARISSSGNAMPEAGDRFGETASQSNRGEVQLVINQVR